jgi:hypothetical protein
MAEPQAQQEQPWFFDAEGWTRYPLYHGTSTYFIASIRAHGLGGRDIIREWCGVQFYRELCALRKRPAPVAYNDGGAWGYGETYLTAYINRARKYKSELLGLIRADLYRMRRVVRDELLGRYPDIAAYLGAKDQPIVLRLPRLHRSTLLGWSSDDPCDSMGGFSFYQWSISVSGFQAPEPTFRLRGTTYDFEIMDCR